MKKSHDEPGAAEEDALGTLYGGLPRTNFSRDVLATCPANLAVLPVSGVVWSDLGRSHGGLWDLRESASGDHTLVYDAPSDR